MLEDVPSEGNSNGSGLHDVVGELEYRGIGVYLHPAGEDHWDRALSDYLSEALRVARVDGLHDVSAALSPDPSDMCNDFWVGRVLDVLAPRVHHRDERHLVFVALVGHHAKLLEHLRLLLGTHVDMDRDGIRPQPDPFEN